MFLSFQFCESSTLRSAGAAAGVMPEPVRGTQPAPVPAHTAVPGSVPAAVPGSVTGPIPGSVPGSVLASASVSSPVAMTASPPSAGAAAEPVPRRAAEDWARYAVPSGHQPPPPAMDAEQARLAAAAAAAAAVAAAAAPAPTGVYGTGGSPQHTVTAPANGERPAAVPAEDTDSGNRNSMGFQITSVTQSSEPDADPIDESGDEDVSDTAETSRTTADGAGMTAAPADGGVSTVDGLPGRLQLPLASSPPPSAGLSPRELTASPGVTGAEVLPVIPTIDGFGITLVPGALESVDARGSAEIVEFPSEIEMDLMPTGLTVGVAPGSPGDDLQETWQSRFKVVKIETNVPFKRGRWQCMDYMDQPEAAGAGTDGPGSAGSSAHSSVQLTTGEPEPMPQPAASEEASLPGLAAEPGFRREAPRIGTATPEPAAAGTAAAAAATAAATTTGAPAAQPSVSVPHQATTQPAATVAGGPPPGLPPGRDAAAASSAPNVHTGDRGGVSLAVGVTSAPSAGLARQNSQPATPEEARLAAADGVPVFRPVEQAPQRQPSAGGLTLPDLLPNSSFLDLVNSVADDQEGTADRYVLNTVYNDSLCNCVSCLSLCILLYKDTIVQVVFVRSHHCVQ